MSQSPGLSFVFGVAGIVFVAIDLIGDHEAWAGYVAIACIVLSMLTRESGFWGRRDPG